MYLPDYLVDISFHCMVFNMTMIMVIRSDKLNVDKSSKSQM